jgi:hypothetical protein
MYIQALSLNQWLGEKLVVLLYQRTAMKYRELTLSSITRSNENTYLENAMSRQWIQTVKHPVKHPLL